MSAYFLRRLLFALPTLFAVSLVAFGLRQAAPGDWVVEYFGADLMPSADPLIQSARYKARAAQLGLDKPAFFFTLQAKAYPDSLHRVFPPARRVWLEELTRQTGSWQASCTYEAAVFDAVRVLEKQPDSLPEKAGLRPLINDLHTAGPERLDSALVYAQRAAGALPEVHQALAGVQTAYDAWKHTDARSALWWPALHWHGADNQYAHWMAGMLGFGEPGLSKQSKRPLWTELRPALYVSLVLNGIAFVFSFLVAVPLGVWMARRHARREERAVRRVLLFTHALPLFWIGAMLMLLFATPGTGFYLIKGIAIRPWPGGGQTFFQWFVAHASKFVLPIGAIVLNNLALLSLQMRGSMLDVLAQDYVRTSKAMGLREKTVYWKHAFRNALFPVITLFGRMLPGVLGGAITIEYLFQIPGMGIKTQQAYYNQDYAMLMALVFLMACITIVGTLLADWLYARVDPRVKLG